MLVQLAPTVNFSWIPRLSVNSATDCADNLRWQADFGTGIITGYAQKETAMVIRQSVLLLIFALALSGCGGGGGGDDDNGIDPSTSMIGTWQPVSATVDGEAVKVSEVMPDTDTEATRWVLVFNQSGTCSFTAYGSTGDTIEVISGTWSSQNQIAPVTTDGETTTIAWTDVGNILTAQYAVDGHQVVAKWVRLIPAPSGHESSMVGTWEAQSVHVNGDEADLADFFGWSTGTRETLELQADGDAYATEWNGDTSVNTMNAEWATGSGVFKMNLEGKTLWGYWEFPLLTLTVLDPENGDTLKMVWTQ